MFMYLGATATASPKMDQTSNNIHSDVEEEFDELGTAILRRGSNPRDNNNNITRSIVVDRNHRKDEELAFCKSMACLLTQTRDLPRLCHSFPTVVRSVGGDGEDTSGSNVMASLDDSSNHSQTLAAATTTHLGTSSAVSSISASASSYHPIGFAAAGSAGVGSVSFNSDTSDATTSSSSSFPYYESIPPPSDR
eukprot:CAMPEP_0113477152 /NCGR_PEP_ID=MMETSP0014_2-20120614/20053_1 /TAXON_ID=2857 /ORGANISM="Nitzschia sp." /LENGTH=192 /DNA_ID=CAMNT_0000370223 /DNA_START=353 /DNA_END=931 /DNA_ORIENTATION=+ /assembly_acc=CAM_ASM_000159